MLETVAFEGDKDPGEDGGPEEQAFKAGGVCVNRDVDE